MGRQAWKHVLKALLYYFQATIVFYIEASLTKRPPKIVMADYISSHPERVLG